MQWMVDLGFWITGVYLMYLCKLGDIIDVDICLNGVMWIRGTGVIDCNLK